MADVALIRAKSDKIIALLSASYGKKRAYQYADILRILDLPVSRGNCRVVSDIAVENNLRRMRPFTRRVNKNVEVVKEPDVKNNPSAELFMKACEAFTNQGVTVKKFLQACTAFCNVIFSEE